MSQPSERSAPGSQAPGLQLAQWEIGDAGFDTDKKLWFIQLYNEVNQNVGTYMAKTIVLKGGFAAQYQWKDIQGRPFWHVRERFFVDQIESIGVDPTGVLLTVTFKDGTGGDESIPEEFDHLTYAFHLSNKDIVNGNRAPLGFIEFHDKDGGVIKRLNNRWVIVENTNRKGVGDYPKIRFRVDKKDIGRVIATQSAIVIQGNNKTG